MKGRFWRKALAAALALLIVSGGVPIKPISDVFGDIGITASADTQYEIDSSTQTLTGGNTYITSNATNDYRITVSGTVTLILRDGTTFNAKKGFTITDGGVLNIRSETEGTGKLIVKADSNTSAINNQAVIDATAIAGNVNIYGGVIEATGGKGADGSLSAESVREAAGKNGGHGIGGDGATVGIYGGTVTAQGSDGGASKKYIKSGTTHDMSYPGGTGGSGICGNVTIQNGKVTATGGNGGQGASDRNGGNGGDAIRGNVTIQNGHVTATGGNGGQGGYDKNGGKGGDAIHGDCSGYGILTANPGSGGPKGSGGSNGSNGVAISGTDTMTRHEHSFTYSADGATITAACTDDCWLDDHKATLTINAPGAHDYYLGAKYRAKISGNTDVLGTPAITYKQQDENGEFTISTGAGGFISSYGTFRASITVGGVTASVDFTIGLRADAPTITQQPADLELTLGSASGNVLSVVATAEGGHTLSYQWYSNTTNSTNGATEINGATEASYTVPTDSEGTIYYCCIVTATRTDNGKTAAEISDVARVTVTAVFEQIYNITIDTLEHGTVTADKETASEGENVTLTVTPDEGYQVKSVSVNGTPIEAETGVYSFTMPAEDVTVSAEFEEQKFTVTWKNAETTLETDTAVPYGTNPTYDGETPTKTGDAQYTYTFSGWSDGTNTYAPNALPAVSGDVTYTAQFDRTVNEYTITWVDGDGNTLKTEQVAYGETPAYTGDTPTKTATAQYSYTFKGWGTITTVAANVTYTAQFDSTVNQYTVTWIDGDGNTLKTDTVDYNTVPSYTGDTPTKTATAQYSYTFNNTWDKAFSPVTSNVTYTAQFDSEVNKYTVTWKNADGTTLETDVNIPYGTTPTYDGATPTKASTSSYTYSFSGWSPAVSSVKGDVTYTATFTAHSTYVPPTYYTITYKVDGKVYQTASSTSGSKITLIDEPTKEGYTFSGWQTSYTTMPARNIEITGTFTINTYAVNFVDEDGVTALADAQTVGWNEKASAPDTPAKDGFVFLYWTADGTTEYDFETAVTDNLTLQAVWKEAVNATVQLDVSSGIVGGKNSLIYVSYAGDLSEGCTVTAVGFYVATNKFLGFTDDNTTNVMDLDGYDVKEIMKNNTTGLVKAYVKAESTHELQLRVGANTSYYFYVLPYVVVTDESGNEYVFYGDVSAATFDRVQ